MKSKEEIINLLKARKSELSVKFGIEDIAMFGSYSRNEHSDLSDIDIFVTLKPGFKSFDNFIELKFFIEELTGKKVDLVIKDSIRKEFKNNILNEAIYA